MSQSRLVLLPDDSPRASRSSMTRASMDEMGWATHSRGASSEALLSDGFDRRNRKDKRTRFIMLVLACCLSLGSHFGSHILGPLKTSLKTSETGFAALITGGELANTITPFVSGMLVPRYGAARVGVVATGTVLLGQLIVCAMIANDEEELHLGGMALGFLLAGGGASPLSVVQESIILRANGIKDHSVPGLAVALCLVTGKTASFLSAAFAKPLANIAPRLPFITAATLSLISFSCCVYYIILERSLEPDDDDDESESHSHKRRMRISDIVTFPTRYWLYAVVCGLVGLWSATIHLSSSLIQTFYGVSATRAGAAASVIQFTSIILYPIIGFSIDKRPQILRNLFVAIPLLIITTHAVLLFYTDVVPYFLSFVPAALGIGCGPLLLVIVVPRLVDPNATPTALGFHKSLEMAGGVLVQFATALILRSSEDKLAASRGAVKLLAGLAFAQLGVILVWWRSIRSSATARRYEDTSNYTPIADEDEVELLAPGTEHALLAARRRRGTTNFYLACAFIATAWVVFGYNYVAAGRVK